MIIPALTVLEPWATCILSGVKPVENRSWRPPSYLFGRRILIHAGKNRAFFNDPMTMAEIRDIWPDMPRTEDDYPLGCLIGHVRLVGWELLEKRPLCPWSCGPICWLLEDPVRIKPTPWIGAQGIWRVKSESLPADLLSVEAFA